MSPPTRLALRDGGRTLMISTHEIWWVEAAGNYVEIRTERKTHLVRHTVKAMARALGSQFVRVRPSIIVNISRVAALNTRAGGDYTVVLCDGTEVRSSRSFRAGIEARLAERPGTARQAIASRRRRRARAAASSSGRERGTMSGGRPMSPHPRSPSEVGEAWSAG